MLHQPWFIMVQQRPLGKASVMQKSSARDRKGRVSPETFINALNRRYAVIQGQYETIEQECEFVTGDALIEAQDRVESDKKLMRRVLEAIEIVARDIDPNWSASQITPIRPKERDDQTGQIMATARSVLRKEGRPMRVREIARAVASARGMGQDEASIARLDRALFAGLKRRLGKEISVEPGPPQRFFVTPTNCA